MYSLRKKENICSLTLKSRYSKLYTAFILPTFFQLRVHIMWTSSRKKVLKLDNFYMKYIVQIRIKVKAMSKCSINLGAFFSSPWRIT